VKGMNFKSAVFQHVTTRGAGQEIVTTVAEKFLYPSVERKYRYYPNIYNAYEHSKLIC
jgi:hypothetical protein